MEERVKAEDYANQLPEHLLHHIFSYLSIKQIVQTSVLSKAWYRAWNTLHILEFNFSHIFEQNRAKYMETESTSDINRQQLYDFADQVLLTRRRQMINLKKFTVRMPWFYLTPHTVSAIDRWIGYALESRVKELKFGAGASHKDENFKYSVPLSVFDSKWMQVLSLSDCKLKLPFSGNVKLSCLKKIALRNVYVDDNFIRELLAGSPMLEYICLREVFGIKELNVFDLAKLGKIAIEMLPDLEKLTINAPKLETITWKIHKWPFSVNLGDSCKNLSFSHAPFSDKWLNEQLTRFPHLENLTLYMCPYLQKIAISNLLVSGLSISCCRDLRIVRIDAPCLRHFTYEGDIVPILSSINCITLSEVSLDFNSKYMDNTWYTELIELLANFNTCFNVLKYVFTSMTGRLQWVVIPEEVRKMVAPPLSNVKELNFHIWSQRKAEALPMVQLEDAMSWIAPHPNSLSISVDHLYKGGVASNRKSLIRERGGVNPVVEKVDVMAKWAVFEPTGPRIERKSQLHFLSLKVLNPNARFK
ncbi:putative F-box protein At1g58310 [Mercurialis annua]|uniref:putative F-box protein At1g58310 n=1 Tax=Mercurialis annua TaxID=3986 RepID=UPI00215E4469|nr:putative F-box protein At1g58310 [Mercurialis annua]